MLALLLLLLAQDPPPEPDPGPQPIPAAGPSTEEAPRVRRGSFTLRVDALHPKGDRKEVLKRMGFSSKLVRSEDPSKGVIDLKRATFRVRVPHGYDPAKPAGLLVWIDPGDAGVVPAEWAEVLDQRNLITVAPNRAGNHTYVWNRASLALAAVRAMGEQYAIAPERLYAAGFSGGGRMASRLALAWPDVFAGGLSIGGATFYQPLADPSRPGYEWPARLKQPSSTLLRRAQKQGRFLLLTGSDDPNRLQCHILAEHMAGAAKFRHVTYMEVPAWGHSPPKPAWFRRAIDALDAPLAVTGKGQKR